MFTSSIQTAWTPPTQVVMAGKVHKADLMYRPGRVFSLMPDWRALADRLETHGIAFVLKPSIRFAGQPGEQATMFFRDPSGNAVEIKAFADLGQLFAR